MYRKDVDFAVRRVEDRVQGAADCSAAVAGWIDEIFGLGRLVRRSEPAMVLHSVAVNHATGIEEELAHARVLIAAPLVRVVTQGVESGAFVAPDPALAADLILRRRRPRVQAWPRRRTAARRIRPG